MHILIDCLIIYENEYILNFCKYKNVIVFMYKHMHPVLL